VKQIHKDYNRAFLLEPTKLIRLMGIIHERLAEHDAYSTHDTFEVFLTGDRREEIDNVDDLLKLDNPPKRKIERLLIVSTAGSVGSARPDHEIQVDFGAPKTSQSGGSSIVVAVSVRSDDAGWAERTISEVEEQLERTWLAYTSHVLWLVGISLLSLFLAVTVLETMGAGRHERQINANTMWLQSSDLDRLEDLMHAEHTLTDQELREITTAQLRNVLGDARPSKQSTPSESRQLFVAIPLLAIMICVTVLFASCYPRAVFLWGDEDERWAATQSRRKLMWSVISTILIGGILANGFYQGIGGLYSGK
jgi:hypothetical protein